MPTQAERKAETQARLLAAAAELFGAQGFHATSTDAVAEAAERTSGAVYAHFGGKEGLLLALLDAWEDRTAAEIAHRLDGVSSREARLATMWTSFARPSGSRADTGMLLEHELWLYAARHADVARELGARYALGRKNLARTLEAWAAEDGEDADLPTEALAALVMALLMGLEMQHRIDPTAVDDALAVEGLARLLRPTRN